ncbi:MAG: hypothetical protein K0S11_597 [Gammaproteobacteria bacterium]|jgi:hypothetical protein|nr:hypothetical protein [Gammaproteobacteria bacterium]
MSSTKSFSPENLKKLINNNARLEKKFPVINPIENFDESETGGGAASPEPFILTQLVGAIREGEKIYGQTPNTEITKDRLLAKQQQNLSERGELEMALGNSQEAHPILANSAYFSGIDQAVNPAMEFMTEEEAAHYAEQLKYQQRKRLEKQMALSSAPTLTRG